LDDAFALADDSALSADQAADAEFLSGWIALRGLKKPALARQKFAALASHAHSAITLARAHYWLGRAAPDDAAAKSEFLRAAAWPLTFYGQKAALASGETEAALKTRIAGLRDPAATPAEAEAVAASELMRAAAILAGWQDSKRAEDFWLRQAEIRPDAAARALVAQAAQRANMPDVAVRIARMAGHEGGMLPQCGWPIPLEPPPSPVPASLVLGIMRQESSFDPKTVSPAGARGLMQVMPQTAAELFRADRRAPGPLSDPAINMRLGTQYLARLLNQFAGGLPYAVAAYDAGPHRVQEWIASPDEDSIDWIESIPFAETRSYVQRVLENAEVYAAKGK
jgi:soluble lytic murein transglycosylase